VAQQQQAVAGVAGRYARALHELAQEAQAVDETAGELERFQALLDGSDDFKRLVKSPVFGAEEQVGALQAIFNSVGIGGLAAKFILLAAKNRRLAMIGEMIQAYRALVARARGEMTADVFSAEELTGRQVEILKAELAASIGGNVMLVTHTDRSLIGGLILKIGSRMIDDSLRTKLQNLKMKMKGVG
jgi:F-type H+-transporting ATPase subunit delta